MFGNIGESGSCDALQRQLRFLDTQNQERHSSGVNNRLCQFSVVSSDVTKCPSSSFLHTRVKLFKTDCQGVKSSRVDDSLVYIQLKMKYW